MTLSQLRVIAHQKGYAISYTFGIHDIATIYPWKKVDNSQVLEIDMHDPIKGSRKLEQAVMNL